MYNSVMSYINVIGTALIIFPIIAFMMTIPYMFYEYRKYGSINKLRTLIIFSFVLYLLCVYFLVILPLPKPESVHTTYLEKINLIPFSFVYDFIMKTPLRISNPATYLKAFKHATFFVPFFNVLMTIPFGMYLRYYFQFDLKKTAIAGLLLSLFFELTQLSGLYFIYSGPYRLCDVDDLIMNTLGAVLGYFIFGFIKNMLPSREKIDEESYAEGEKVPSIRRMFAFIIDLMIIGFVNIFINKGALSFAIIFIIYYCSLEMYNNQTIGMKVMRYRISFRHERIKNIIELNLLRYLYYFGVFEIIAFILDYLERYRNTLITMIIFIGVCLLFGYFIYLVMIVLLNKKTLYERAVDVKYISQVKR